MFRMSYIAVPIIQLYSIKLLFNYYLTDESGILSVWACNKVSNFKVSVMHVFSAFSRDSECICR
jgi:hypothetical protein